MNDAAGAPSSPEDTGTTQIRLPMRSPAGPAIAWAHSLRVVDGDQTGRRHRIGDEPLRIGRRAGNALVIPDTEVSGEHCEVRAAAGQRWAEVTDRGSTNGTYIDGRRVHGTQRLDDGALLQVGRHVLVHECRSRLEMDRAEEVDRELERARHYVESLLPAPMRSGPVQTSWFFRPSAQLGGDGFGYFALGAERFAGYVVDVTGHGVGVAMHTVSVMNILRQRALPATDFGDPAQVLARLNAMFQMDEHDGLCFTMWYGVYDLPTRTLSYASAGHHPALLRTPRQGETLRLATRSLPLGALPDSVYATARVPVPPDSRLLLFSDGLFEVRDRQGRGWGLDDLVPRVETLGPGAEAPAQLYRAVRDAVGDGPLDDDCSIVIVDFP